MEDDLLCSLVGCVMDNLFMSRELTSALISELSQFDRYRSPCHILIDSYET